MSNIFDQFNAGYIDLEELDRQERIKFGIARYDPDYKTLDFFWPEHLNADGQPKYEHPSYHIELEDVETGEKFLGILRHLCGKGWFNTKLTRDAIRAYGKHIDKDIYW